MLSDLARTDPLTAAPDTPVEDVVTAMRTHDESLVVVLDEQVPLGVVSSHDIGLAVGTREALSTAPASDIVRSTPTIRERASRAGLLSRFRETGVETLVVVDDAEEFVGVVSRRDLLSTYTDEFDALFSLF